MDILFVHRNFPGQFSHLLENLAQRPGLRVFGIGGKTAKSHSGAKLVRYTLPRGAEVTAHPFAQKLEADGVRAEQVLYAALELQRGGMDPALIVVHPGWGEAIPLRELFPDAKIVSYCEFYYNPTGADLGFDPEFSEVGVDGRIRLRTRNVSFLLSLLEADVGLSPTSWQRDRFPAELRHKISVVHDGVDTTKVRPDPEAVFTTGGGHPLTGRDQVVTYVARNLEPYRGYHIFMRSLPRLLQALPNAHVLVLGGAEVSYGNAPPGALSWKEIFLDEVRDKIDLSRVHFMGHTAYADYLRALQVSAAHVYLTYPFVLSWSAIEALAAGCLVIGSDTAPVREVVTDGENGFLVPFFDHQLLSERVIEAVRNRDKHQAVRRTARDYATANFDLHTVCLPRQTELLFKGLEVSAEPPAESDHGSNPSRTRGAGRPPAKGKRSPRTR